MSFWAFRLFFYFLSYSLWLLSLSLVFVKSSKFNLLTWIGLLLLTKLWKFSSVSAISFKTPLFSDTLIELAWVVAFPEEYLLLDCFYRVFCLANVNSSTMFSVWVFSLGVLNEKWVISSALAEWGLLEIAIFFSLLSSCKNDELRRCSVVHLWVGSTLSNPEIISWAWIGILSLKSNLLYLTFFSVSCTDSASNGGTPVYIA